jgi:hypothetical protein
MLLGRSRVVTLAILAFVAGIVLAIAEAARRGADRRPVLELVSSATDTPSAAPPASWVLPHDNGCPTGFPVKVKESSGIYHLPGGAHYERVHPDRCYTNAESATADGFRQSRT